MTINELISKWNMKLVEQDGKVGIQIQGKATPKQIEEIKASKDQLIEELRRRKAERDARDAERQARVEKEKAEYISTADLRRCLVLYQDEYFHTKAYIETLQFEDGRAWRAMYGVSNHVSLAHTTETMDAVQTQDYIQYGMGGVAWEITPEQEAQIVAEQTPAAAEAEKKAVAKAQKQAGEKAATEAKKQADRQAKFDEAKVTAKPVLLRKWCEDCCDPREECNLDVHYEYAMPDGSVKHEWNHTW